MFYIIYIRDTRPYPIRAEPDAMWNMASNEVLEQICENCNLGYCTVRNILQERKIKPAECRHFEDDHFYCDNFLELVKLALSDRTLLQFKCVEEYKWIKSEETGRDIGWNNAYFGWIADGYAKKFAEVYNSGERDIFFFFKAGTVPRRKFHHKEPAKVENRDYVAAVA